MPQMREKDRLKNQLGEALSGDPNWAAESRPNHSWSTHVSFSGAYVGFRSNISKQEVSLIHTTVTTESLQGPGMEYPLRCWATFS